jgi:hypothetical protein
MKCRKRLPVCGVLFLGTFLCLPRIGAQEAQEPSVADAARRARDQKKNTTKPAPVITNDTFAPAAGSAATPTTSPEGQAAVSPTPPRSGPLALTSEARAAAETQSRQAQASAARSSTSAAVAAEASAADSTPAKLPAETGNADAKKAELAALRQQISDQQHQVDLLQRQFTLENESFHSQADYAHDKDGKAKLDALQADLSQQQLELARLKAKLAAIAPADNAKPAPAKP